MGRAKLRKLRGRGRARDWHLSHRLRPQLESAEEREWRTKPLAERQAWFEREVGKMLGETFDPKNVKRMLGPLGGAVALGQPIIKVRRV